MKTIGNPVQVIIQGDPGSDASDAAHIAAADSKWDDCAHYTNCLARCHSVGWVQFSCAECNDFEGSEQKPVEIRRLMSIFDVEHEISAGSSETGDE